MIFHLCVVTVNCSLSAAGSPPATHEWKEKSVPIYWQWRHDSSAHILVCIANMWIQKIRTTWFSGINIKVCSLLFLILTHHSLSLCTQNQRCDPGLVFPRSLPVNTQWICTACFPVFCSAKLRSSKPWNSSIPRMAKFWPLNHFWVSYKWREERK